MNIPKTYQQQSKRVHTGILPSLFDKVDVSYPTDVQETYTYSLYQADNNTYRVTAIIDVVYTDNTKEFITSVTKTFNDSGFD